MSGTTEAFARVRIEANRPNLTNEEMLYVEISRARDRAELVSDDKAGLKEQLAALGEDRTRALQTGPAQCWRLPGRDAVGARDARASRRRRRSRSPRNAIWGCEAYASSGAN